MRPILKNERNEDESNETYSVKLYPFSKKLKHFSETYSSIDNISRNSQTAVKFQLVMWLLYKIYKIKTWKILILVHLRPVALHPLKLTEIFELLKSILMPFGSDLV